MLFVCSVPNPLQHLTLSDEQKISYMHTDHKGLKKEYGTMCRMKTTAITCSDINDLKIYAQHGADEVIFAPVNCSFSALQEIREEDLKEAIDTAHQLGMKVSLLMNRLFGNSEILAAEKKMDTYMQYGADGIIFADPGLAYHACKTGCMDRMIYQPDTLVTSSYDASFWMNQGLKSVTVSPLITKDEIVAMTQQTEGLSLVVHVRLMMSVSKRRLLSAFKDETGLSFHPEHNRSLYLVEEKRDGKMPVYENAYACMIYSDFVQESFDEMPSFQKASRFVIDGAWLPLQESVDALDIYKGMIEGKDMQREIEAYRSTYGKEGRLSDGYYGLKTIR